VLWAALSIDLEEAGDLRLYIVSELGHGKVRRGKVWHGHFKSEEAPCDIKQTEAAMPQAT